MEGRTRISTSSPECSHWSRTQQKSLLYVEGRDTPEPTDGKGGRAVGEWGLRAVGEEGMRAGWEGGVGGAETSTWDVEEADESGGSEENGISSS